MGGPGPCGGVQPAQHLTGRDRIPRPAGGQHPEPFVRSSQGLGGHVTVGVHPMPRRPSRKPGLLLVTVNTSRAKRIVVIGDPELVAIGHHHAYVRLPPVALCSRPGSRTHTGRPGRRAGRHLIDHGLDAGGDESILLDCPPTNRIRSHGT